MVGIDSEFGELKVCAVGAPYTVEFIDGCWIERHYSWLDEECKALNTILKEFGTDIIEPERITVEEFGLKYPYNPLHYGCSQVFPRDYVACIDSKILFVGCKPSPAVFYQLESVSDILPGTTVYDKISNEPMVEGGDIMFLEEDILVGHSGHPSSISNECGVEWLSKCSGRPVVCQPFPNDFVHLDMAMSVVNDNVVMCDSRLALPSTIEDTEIIRVPSIDARKGLINGISLCPDIYVTPMLEGYACPAIVEQLSQKGIDVIELEYGRHLRMLGGIRCSTVPLIRMRRF